MNEKLEKYTARALFLHGEALHDDGGIQGVKKGCVEGIVGNALNATAYYSADGEGFDIIVFSAYGFYYLIKDHCFSDGNKRTAWMFLIDGIQEDNFELDADTDVGAAFCRKVIDNEMTFEDILLWISSRIIPCEELVT